MCTKARLALALSCLAAISHGQAAVAQDLSQRLPARIMTSAGDWGGVGLLQTRTARFSPDGAFEVGYSFVDPYKRLYITSTFFPWLEATFRYTEIRNRFYSDVPEFSHDQRYKDRGADLKLRLTNEGRYLPATAIGFQDILGTGIFAGEYLVASKRWRDLDLSVGLGWGTIGSGGSVANPLRLGDRTGEDGLGGQLSLGSFFRGERVGLFGGVEYQTPIAGLTLKLEYDAQRYADDTLNHPATSPYNFGVVFRPYPAIELSFGRERGNTTMLRFALRSDLHGPGIPKMDPPPPPVAARPTMAAIEATALPPPRPADAVLRILGINPPPPPAPREPDPAAVANAIFDTLAARGLEVEGFAIADREAVVTTARVAAARESLSASANAALAQVPSDILALTLVETSRGAEVGRGRAVRAGAAVRAPAGDALGLRLGVLDLEVVEVQLDAPAAFITVRSRDNRPPDLSAAARAAIPALPAMTSVTIVDARSRLSETWLTGFTPTAPQPPAPRSIEAAAGVPLLTAMFTEGQRLVVARRLQDALIAEGVVLEALELEGTRAFVSFSAFRYPQLARNQGLAARVAVNNLPAEIEDITLAFLNGGIEMTRLSFRRTDLESAVVHLTADELIARGSVGPGEPGYPGGWVPGRYPRFSWSLSPQLRQHVGGPDRFYLYQAWLSASAGVDIVRGLSLTSQFGKNLYNNFKLLTLESDSLLPKVRSDIKNYLQQGADGNIVRLQANFLAKPAQDVYFRLSAGLLEEMYGGISSEVLYRPFASRFAVGAELSWVTQRDFDQRLKFRDYSVATGHVSLYYDTPYRNVRVATHAGRYLAGDVGATFELSRRFDSGVRIGAWATFTDVPPGMFGEGSFDKGFFIVIPFDVFTLQSVRANGVFAFRPLTRDGGQRLVLSHRLFDLTNPASLGEVTRDFDRFLQ